MKFLKLIIVIVFLFAFNCFAQQNEPFIENILSKKITKEISIRYLIHLPKNYDSSLGNLPLLIYLHGGLGRGNDFQKLYWYPIPKMIRENKFPDSFVVLIPQCPEGKYWPELTDELRSLINEIKEKYNIDTSRIYGMGYSMGGNGIVEFAFRNPHMFAAIAAMSGYYFNLWVSRIKDIPIWFFHGAKDNRIELKEADEIVEEYKKFGVDVKYTRDPEGGHNPPTIEQHLEVLQWLLTHSK